MSSPGELRSLAVTQTPVKNHQLTLKNSKGVNNYKKKKKNINNNSNNNNNNNNNDNKHESDCDTIYN